MAFAPRPNHQLKNGVCPRFLKTVLDWWKEKLETRKTVPPPATHSTTAKMVANDPFGWNQIVAFDYLELSYYSFCRKKDLDNLPPEEFHAVFVHLFTDRYTPRVSELEWYGFRKYIDPESKKDEISRYDYMVVPCYKIPNVFFCRALYEMVTESDPIEWLDGTRMKENYKGSPAFWRELSMDKMEEDKFVQYGEHAFLPDYMKRAHRSRL